MIDSSWIESFPEWVLSAWFWSQILATLVLPPASLLLLGLFGISMTRARPRLGAGVATVAVVALWAMSTPWIGHQLESTIVDRHAFDPASLQFQNVDEAPQAIAVLGGGRIKGAIEWGGEDLTGRSLARVRYAARLYRATRLPVVAIGGKPEGGERAEAALMKAALEDEFGVPVRLVETESENTRENARRAAVLLKGAGIERILLVTDATHMVRARAEFRAAGLRVTPAPTGFTTFYPADPKEWLPTPSGLRMSSNALRELIGLGWAQLRSMISGAMP